MHFDGHGKDRYIIPRWRPVGRSVQLGEAWSAEKRVETAPLGERRLMGLARAMDTFRQHRAAPYAAEVVAVAVMEGVPERAREAARFLVRYGEDLAVGHRLIDHCLGQASDADTPTSLTTDDIRAFRVAGPYVREGGFAWLDLALAYASCGLYSKAERALTVARGLVGTTNRLVLRAEARLYQHMGDPERALATLRRDPDYLLADPWLMAPEIGLSQLVGKHSRLVRRARAMFEQRDRPPFHVSELAAAVGTTELAAGKHRFARKFFRLAVVDPAEQGLAQTVWAAREVDPLIRVPDRHALRKSAEARARDAVAQLRWRDAEKACKEWRHEEPFATMPAVILSSLLSTHLSDEEGAVEAANAGLVANPNHPVLLNNRAFALANMGRLDEAETDIKRITNESTDQNVTNRICITATKGLIAFRRGQQKKGEHHYRRAMAMARDERNSDLAARAGIYLIREARLANMNDLAQDPAVLKAVNAKGLLPATERLRKEIVERDLHWWLTNFANLSTRLGGPRRSNFERPVSTARQLPGAPPDKKD